MALRLSGMLMKTGINHGDRIIYCAISISGVRSNSIVNPISTILYQETHRKMGTATKQGRYEQLLKQY